MMTNDFASARLLRFLNQPGLTEEDLILAFGRAVAHAIFPVIERKQESISLEDMRNARGIGEKRFSTMLEVADTGRLPGDTKEPPTNEGQKGLLPTDSISTELLPESVFPEVELGREILSSLAEIPPTLHRMVLLASDIWEKSHIALLEDEEKKLEDIKKKMTADELKLLVRVLLSDPEIQKNIGAKQRLEVAFQALPQQRGPAITAIDLALSWLRGAAFIRLLGSVLGIILDLLKPDLFAFLKISNALKLLAVLAKFTKRLRKYAKRLTALAEKAEEIEKILAAIEDAQDKIEKAKELKDELDKIKAEADKIKKEMEKAMKSIDD